MRFAAIHKLSSYLMVACAFGSLALSGELPAIVVALGGLGLLASWWWESPRVRLERWTPWWNALVLGGFGYTLLAAYTRGEWIVSGANFLTLLMVAKLFTRRTSRDYQWIYILSFLMLVAGTTLNADLNYALFFIGYVITATWAMILHHLRREMEENFLVKHADDSSSKRVEVERIMQSRRVVGFKFLLATSSASLLIFFLSAALFLLFPRVGFGLFFSSGRQRMTFAGFSDNVTLGGHGLIRTDDTVVMRIKVDDPTYTGPTAPELHWRGVAFDRYSHGKWSRTRNAFATRGKSQRLESSTRILLDAANALASLTDAHVLRQEIYLEPLDTSTLFAAAEPLAFELENVAPGSAATYGQYGQNDEVRYTHYAGLRYLAWSDPRTPSSVELAAAPDADPRAFAAYLEIPPEIPRRVIDKALEITKGKTGPYAKAEAIERYLKANYTYTLVMNATEGREPLDEFLFDRKMGHCEYFSSAMAIMLRAAGVPTRNVNGFLGGEWNEYGHYIAVRGGDAHSWVEVWFDGPNRWVTYDPTPAGTSLPLSRGGGGVLEKLRRLLDNLRLAWFKWVIEFDLGSQLSLMSGLGKLFKLGSGALGGAALKAWFKAHATAVGTGLGALVLAVGGLGFWRRRRGGPAAPGEEKRVADHPVVGVYLAASRRLARRGHERPPARTPREHAASLVAAAAPGAAPYAALTELYYTVRYAPAPVAQAVDLAAARGLADEVRRSIAAAPK